MQAASVCMFLHIPTIALSLTAMTYTLRPVIFISDLPDAMGILRPIENGRHFADDIFKRIFFNETVSISNKVSLKFVPKGPCNNIPALVQIMAWRRPGDKLLSEPMMLISMTHICVTRPQCVNTWPSLQRKTTGNNNIWDEIQEHYNADADRTFLTRW